MISPGASVRRSTFRSIGRGVIIFRSERSTNPPLLLIVPRDAEIVLNLRDLFPHRGAIVPRRAIQGTTDDLELDNGATAFWTVNYREPDAVQGRSRGSESIDRSLETALLHRSAFSLSTGRVEAIKREIHSRLVMDTPIDRSY